MRARPTDLIRYTGSDQPIDRAIDYLSPSRHALDPSIPAEMSSHEEEPLNDSLPSEAYLKGLSEDERLVQARQAAQAAAATQSMVDSLQSKAALLTNPSERERVLSEAYDREIEAKGFSRKAAILKSGTFQGAAGGAGIGAATGLGLGAVVGTVVGAVASVPTTAVGGLVGAGTGAIHGPWIKLGDKKEKNGKESGKEEKEGEVPSENTDSDDAS